MIVSFSDCGPHKGCLPAQIEASQPEMLLSFISMVVFSGILSTFPSLIPRNNNLFFYSRFDADDNMLLLSSYSSDTHN